MAGEDLLLDGAQVERVRHLLIVLAVPVGTPKQHNQLSLIQFETDFKSLHLIKSVLHSET